MKMIILHARKFLSRFKHSLLQMIATMLFYIETVSIFICVGLTTVDIHMCAVNDCRYSYVCG